MKVWQTLEHLTRNGILTRRRKHKCLECDHRSTTVEIPEYYLYHYLKEIGEEK
jgi:transcriptional regulator NrdR family protein